MIRHMAWCLTVAAFGLLSGAAAASGGRESPDAGTPDAESVQRLLQELDSDDFRTREAATQELAASGSAAVEAVVEAVASSASPEVRWRAFLVLAAMSVADDRTASDKAWAALDQLAESEDRAVAASARTALKRWRQIRHERAVAECRGLGAVVQDLNDQEHFGLLAAFGEVTPADLSAGNWALQLDQNWQGGDQGLRFAADIINLTTIELQDAPITENALEHFERIPELKSIQVYQGKISGDAWRGLRKKRPEMNIFAVGEGFLGVNGNSTEKGLHVTTVFPGSCADKSGVQVGDVIASVNNLPLSDVASLTLCVFDKPKGHPVTLEVHRAEETLVLKGALSSREELQRVRR